MSDVIDMDHLRGWIGREQVVDEVLAPFPARALAAAIARADAPEMGDALPPAWQWLYFLDAVPAGATGADGHPARGGFLPPVPLPRRMWAAGEMTIERPLVIGREARKVSRIADVACKEGRSGTLVFVTVEHRYEQDGALCIAEQQSLVYRAPGPPVPLPGGEEQPAAGVVRRLVPDPVLLFRYSALTYNGHRIHYDAPYAAGEEGYPGLVVHGPLIATLLLEAARPTLGGRAVGHFAFRAERPAFAGVPLRLCVQEEDGRMSLQSVDPCGAAGMRATVTPGVA